MIVWVILNKDPTIQETKGQNKHKLTTKMERTGTIQTLKLNHHIKLQIKMNCNKTMDKVRHMQMEFKPQRTARLAKGNLKCLAKVEIKIQAPLSQRMQQQYLQILSLRTQQAIMKRLIIKELHKTIIKLNNQRLLLLLKHKHRKQKQMDNKLQLQSDITF